MKRKKGNLFCYFEDGDDLVLWLSSKKYIRLCCGNLSISSELEPASILDWDAVLQAGTYRVV